MDAKITPEQAIEILRQEIIEYSPVSKFVKPISRTRANDIANLIESLAADAELGRAAVTAIDTLHTDYSNQPCDEPIYDNSRSCKTCTWKYFCRLRAGKGEE